MRKNQHVSPETIVCGIFGEALSVGRVVSTLLSSGFADNKIEAVGWLEGEAPDLTRFLHTMGIPSADASYCNSCFHEGGVLLIIRTHPLLERIALEIIRGHGGVLPPGNEIQSPTVQ